MLTNLLPVKSLPRNLMTASTNFSGQDAYTILKDSKYIFYSKAKKVYFFGEPNQIHDKIIDRGFSCNTEPPIPMISENIIVNWDVIRILFYKGLKEFLRVKGLFHHSYKRNCSYMVRHQMSGRTELVKIVDLPLELYTHEGLEHRFDWVNGKLYLALFPRIVVTKDGKGDVLSISSDVHTKLTQHRYNGISRARLDFWAEYLGNKNSIDVPLSPYETLSISENYLDIKVRGERRSILDW